LLYFHHSFSLNSWYYTVNELFSFISLFVCSLINLFTYLCIVNLLNLYSITYNPLHSLYADFWVFLHLYGKSNFPRCNQFKPTCFVLTCLDCPKAVPYLPAGMVQANLMLLFCSSSPISHFYKESWSLLVENSI
jgi:hypothetical protein